MSEILTLYEQQRPNQNKHLCQKRSSVPVSKIRTNLQAPEK